MRTPCEFCGQGCNGGRTVCTACRKEHRIAANDPRTLPKPHAMRPSRAHIEAQIAQKKARIAKMLPTLERILTAPDGSLAKAGEAFGVSRERVRQWIRDNPELQHLDRGAVRSQRKATRRAKIAIIRGANAEIRAHHQAG
jgi:hypothetical protein